VLLLSQFTGAARELPEALVVNPYDADQCATALDAALTMPLRMQRARMRLMRGLLREFNVFRWAGRMLLDAVLIEHERTVPVDSQVERRPHRHIQRRPPLRAPPPAHPPHRGPRRPSLGNPDSRRRPPGDSPAQANGPPAPATAQHQPPRRVVRHAQGASARPDGRPKTRGCRIIATRAHPHGSDIRGPPSLSGRRTLMQEPAQHHKTRRRPNHQVLSNRPIGRKAWSFFAHSAYSEQVLRRSGALAHSHG